MCGKAASGREGEVSDMDVDVDVDEEEDNENDGDESELLSQCVTLGCMEMVDGRLVIETVDLEEVDTIFSGLQEDSDPTEDANRHMHSD